MEPGVEVLSDKGLRVASNGELCSACSDHMTVMPQVTATLFKDYMLQCCTFVGINGHVSVINKRTPLEDVGTKMVSMWR